MKRLQKISAIIMTAIICFSSIGCGAGEDTSKSDINTKDDVAVQENAAASNSGQENSNKEVSGSGEKVTIHYATYEVGTHLGVQTTTELLQRFRDKNSDTIELVVEELPTDTTYTEKMKTLVATNDLPDVVDGKNGLRDLALQNGQVVYLNDYLDSDPEFRDKVIGPDAIAANTDEDGNVLSIVCGAQAVGYFYNKDMFADAGLKPAETWEEFNENCEKLLSAGYTPLGLMTGENSWTTNLLLAAMVGGKGEAGVELMNTKYPDTYQTPEMISALEDMQIYLQKYTTPDALGAGYANVANNFLTEQVAMVFNGSWMIASFSEEDKANPGLADRIGFALYPGNGLIQTYAEGYVMCASTKETQDAAWELIKELTGTETQMGRMTREGGIPVSSYIEITDEYRQENPLFAENVDAVQKAEYSVATFDVMAYANVVDAFGIYYPELVNGTLDAAGMAARLDEAAAAAQ